MLLALISCFSFPVNKTLHASFDKYDFFAIVPAKDVAQKLHTLLEQDLAARQEEWNRLPRRSEPKRQYGTLHPDEPLIQNAEFELILLHPQQLLPNALPLLRWEPSDNTYASYTLSPDMELKDATGAIFPKFTYECTRQVDERPNIYCMILNAYAKFLTFRRRHDITTLPEGPREAVNRTIELAELILRRLTPPPGSQDIPVRASDHPSRQVEYHEYSSEDMEEDSSEPGTLTTQSPDSSSRQHTSSTVI